MPLLALQTGLFFLLSVDWGGEGQKGSSHLKSSSLGIRNLPANTSSGYFGTPHNTCSSLLAGSEWRGCCRALWWGVLLLLLHFLPLVWHSRSLNYVWTASNILYHQAGVTYFIFKGCGAQSDPLCNYDLLKMIPNDRRCLGPNPEPPLRIMRGGTPHGWTVCQQRFLFFDGSTLQITCMRSAAIVQFWSHRGFKTARSAPMEVGFFSSFLSLFGNRWLLGMDVIGEVPQATCSDTLWALSWLVLAPCAQKHNEKTQFSREKTSQTACLPFTQHGGIKNGWAPHPLFQPPNGKICIKPWVAVWVKINKSNMRFSVSCLFFFLA